MTKNECKNRVKENIHLEGKIFHLKNTFLDYKVIRVFENESKISGQYKVYVTSERGPVTPEIAPLTEEIDVFLSRFEPAAG